MFLYCFTIDIVMQTTISITSRWQIHIPKAVRQALELTSPGKIEIRAVENSLVLTPVESKILKLAGRYEKYAKGKKVNLDKIRDYIDYSKA